MNEDIASILNKPILDKLRDASFGLNGNIKILYDMSERYVDIKDNVEYARYNGQIWGLAFAKGMIDSIIRLEESRAYHQEKEKEDGRE